MPRFCSGFLGNFFRRDCRPSPYPTSFSTAELSGPRMMFFGTGAKVPEELSLAKGNARAARIAANRAMSCERCVGQRASLPGEQIPH